MGKTRLLEELTAEIADEAAIAHTRYPAYGGLGGPQVAADIAEQLGLMGEHEVDVRVKAVAGDVDDSLRDLDPGAFRQEQLWAYRRYLEAKAADQPILIIIDDIHRTGDQTLELLGELMGRILEVPILLVLSGRPEPGEWLARFPGSTTVRLSPLSPEDSMSLVTSLRPAGTAPDDTVRALVGRGRGNPLYLRELVAVVCAEGGAAPASLPPSLQAILAARLDALRPEEKGAIQRASVLGDVATEDQMAMLGLADVSALRNLVAAGLLRQRKDDCYEVVDPLLREVAYETLPRQVRGEWHRRAADAVRDPVQRARQLERAVGYLPDDETLSAETAAALREAGVNLIDGYRIDDGISLLLRAVQHGERGPAVLLRLASALTNNGRGEEAATVLSHLDEADVTAEQLAERAHIQAVSHMFRNPETSLAPLAEAAQRWHDLDEPVKEGWAWSNRGVALFNSGQMAEASDNLERAIELFGAHGEYNGKLAAQSFLALIRPDDPRVSDWLEEGLRRAEDLGDRSGQANSLVLLAWHHIFRSHLGGREQMALAEHYADRGRDMAADLGFHEFHAHGLCLGALTRRFTGRLDDAVDLAERAGDVPLESNSPVRELVKGVQFLASVARESDAVEPALSTSNDPVVWVGWLTTVEALLLAGRVDDAERLVTDIENLPGLGGAIDGMTRSLTVGLAMLMTDRADEAAPLLREALASARAVRSDSMMQAAHALLAETHARTGEGDEARRYLEKAGAPAPDGVCGALVVRARTVLGEADAAVDLRRMAEELGAPGLLVGTT
jgi:tetratricopeptide (TPR) repeat protein